MIDAILTFLVIYDVSVSFLSFYSFYILILRPFLKYRHTAKNGIYTDLTLYDNGQYRGSITLNASELLSMLFKFIGEHNEQQHDNKEI